MNFLKKAGKMLVTLTIIATAIYILIEHPKYWAAAIVLAFILAMWLQLVYHLFKRVNVSNKGFMFDGDIESSKAKAETSGINADDFEKLQKRTDKLEQDIRSLKEKLSDREDFHKEFKQFRMSKSDLDVIMVEGYESPSRLTEFTNLVKRAKTNGYDLSSDTTYQGLTKGYRQHITDQLKTVLKTLDYSSEFSGRMQKLLENAMVSVPTNQEVIASIKKELISANENNKLEISDVFFKATNDLKKLKS